VKTSAVPSSFKWGVSTAGYQWEGQDTSSQWAAWDAAGKTPERNVRGADGLTRYETDMKLTQGLGANTFRTSIEWSRIEPTKGQIDPQAVAVYHDMLRSMKAHGLTPVITLHHFSHPEWLAKEGGWENPASADAFGRYAAFVAKEFGAEIDTYLTFNEPNVYLAGGYLAGAMPPGKQNPIAAYKAMKNMIRGHKLAYAAVHANDATSKVSFNRYTAEYALRSVQDVQTAEEKALSSDTWMLDQVTGINAEDGTKGRTIDFVAFDYYCRLKVKLPFALPRPDTWEVYPEGMYKAAKRFHARYKLPVLVAENGLATHDGAPRADGWTRSAYTVAHVQQMQRAMAEGVPVMGYIHWSITDNYEWGSFSPRFGLYQVDCRNGDFRRVPTDGVEAFRSVIGQGGVSQPLAAKYLLGKAGGINLQVPSSDRSSQVSTHW
jgi:beta-glucosidase